MSKIILQSFADLLLSLSAAWFGIVIILPSKNISFISILNNFILGVVFFYAGVKIKTIWTIQE